MSAGAFVMAATSSDRSAATGIPAGRGWWGEDPLAMQGGTTFRFITDGIHPALDQARPAAGAREVAIAGGAATVTRASPPA